jgi:hypothetical protein
VSDSPLRLNPWMRGALEQQGYDPDDVERRWHESRRREQIVYEDSPDSGYRCTCPLPRDEAHEDELALACAEREQAHQAASAEGGRDSERRASGRGGVESSGECGLRWRSTGAAWVASPTPRADGVTPV